MRKPSPPVQKKVCVAKLTRNVTKDHVMEIFGNFGNVIYCDLPMDKQKSWINTSLAYVEYEKLEEADECVKKMNGGKCFYPTYHFTKTAEFLIHRL